MKRVEGTKMQSKIVLCENKSKYNIGSHTPPKPGDCLHKCLHKRTGYFFN